MAKPYTSSTDGEILESIGERLRALRRARGLTQQQAADRAGLARSTVSEAERGDNATLLTVIRLLRVYGRVAALEGFIPEPELSPMARLRERKQREDEARKGNGPKATTEQEEKEPSEEDRKGQEGIPDG